MAASPMTDTLSDTLAQRIDMVKAALREIDRGDLADLIHSPERCRMMNAPHEENSEAIRWRRSGATADDITIRKACLLMATRLVPNQQFTCHSCWFDSFNIRSSPCPRFPAIEVLAGADCRRRR